MLIMKLDVSVSSFLDYYMMESGNLIFCYAIQGGKNNIKKKARALVDKYRNEQKGKGISCMLLVQIYIIIVF